MKLQSERLNTIASLVKQDHIFADVGTDHAHIPSYLIL
ncbi:MAG: SAM-dependent methyltransferase, partial [Clostridia bacterium]|nr:SAM-dependent methyltransferase [Clostridia bacterium]